MRQILCTFPGRLGDILWSLPTARAIALANGGTVSFAIAGEFGALASLLETAPYLQHVLVLDTWGVHPPDEWCAPGVEGFNYRVVHLGYRGWPQAPLAQAIYTQTSQEYRDLPMMPLDLATPWLTAEPFPGVRPAYVEGWTECWFELKVGLRTLLWDTLVSKSLRYAAPGKFPVNVSTTGRWAQEYGVAGCDWLTTARWLASTQVCLTDCSAVHVLACALGIPVVMVEPMEARHNPIFYPYGMDGPQVTMVKGQDGKPTTDARHVADVLRPYLEAACRSW